MEGKAAQPATIDEYISQYPADIQRRLVELRAIVHESAPGIVEKISYGMPSFYLNGGLLSFGVYKRHIGLYPVTSAMNAFGDEMVAYEAAKSSLHFPLNEPMPYELIGKLVKARVTENREENGVSAKTSARKPHP